jgi:hypothetical protein
MLIDGSDKSSRCVNAGGAGTKARDAYPKGKSEATLGFAGLTEKFRVLWPASLSGKSPLPSAPLNRNWHMLSITEK